MADPERHPFLQGLSKHRGSPPTVVVIFGASGDLTARKLIPAIYNLSYDNLGSTGKLYPNPDPEHSDGTVVMFGETFKTDDGLAHLVPAEWMPAKELPSDEYPMIVVSEQRPTAAPVERTAPVTSRSPSCT